MSFQSVAIGKLLLTEVTLELDVHVRSFDVKVQVFFSLEGFFAVMTFVDENGFVFVEILQTFDSPLVDLQTLPGGECLLAEVTLRFVAGLDDVAVIVVLVLEGGDGLPLDPGHAVDAAPVLEQSFAG